LTSFAVLDRAVTRFGGRNVWLGLENKACTSAAPSSMYTSETRTARMIKESVVVNTAKLTRGKLMTRSEIAGRNGMNFSTIEIDGPGAFE